MMPSPVDPHTPPAITVVAGLGCRRGCSLENLSTALHDSLAAQYLTVDNLAGLASIEHKRNEPALLHLAERLGLPLICFSPAQLAPYQRLTAGNALTLSATGSPAVAEPCALALAAHLGAVGRRLGEKTRNASATCALALLDRKDTP